MRLLLLSNSRQPGAGFLDHAIDRVAELFTGLDRIVFIPFALHDQAGYARIVRERLAALGIAVDPVAPGSEAASAIASAKGVFVGGGNTFRLLDRIQRSNLLEPLRRRVISGMPYLGASAGTVIAAPTISTTNDMPIVQPASFEALGLLPFHINCHYLDPDPGSRHMGETREQRLVEFLEENDRIVVGLREGSWLRCSGPTDGPLAVHLEGSAPCRVFRRGTAPTEMRSGDRLDALAAR